MKAARYAVFIEPTGPLREVLVEGKRLLELRMPGQPYCGHPPHCTLIVGQYAAYDAWASVLRDRVGTLRAFEFRTESWCLFHDDPGAGGGQTVALRVAMNKPLLALQLAAAESLRPFMDDVRDTESPFGAREPFAGSLLRYGFPFVGAHWIAHFTVGSPRVARDSALLADLTRAAPCHTQTVESISVWEIVGEAHNKIAAFPLAPYSHR